MSAYDLYNQLVDEGVENPDLEAFKQQTDNFYLMSVLGLEKAIVFANHLLKQYKNDDYIDIILNNKKECQEPESYLWLCELFKYPGLIDNVPDYVVEGMVDAQRYSCCQYIIKEFNNLDRNGYDDRRTLLEYRYYRMLSNQSISQERKQKIINFFNYYYLEADMVDFITQFTGCNVLASLLEYYPFDNLSDITLHYIACEFMPKYFSPKTEDVAKVFFKYLVDKRPHIVKSKWLLTFVRRNSLDLVKILLS